MYTVTTNDHRGTEIMDDIILEVGRAGIFQNRAGPGPRLSAIFGPRAGPSFSEFEKSGLGP